MAPEILSSLPYRGPEQDMWYICVYNRALGVILYRMLNARNPFGDLSEMQVPYVNRVGVSKGFHQLT